MGSRDTFLAIIRGQDRRSATPVVSSRGPPSDRRAGGSRRSIILRYEHAPATAPTMAPRLGW